MGLAEVDRWLAEKSAERPSGGLAAVDEFLRSHPIPSRFPLFRRPQQTLVAPAPEGLLDYPQAPALEEEPAPDIRLGPFRRALARGAARSAVGTVARLVSGAEAPEGPEAPEETTFVERAVENLGTFLPDLPLYVAGGGVGGFAVRTALKGVLRHYLTKGYTPQAALAALRRSALTRLAPAAGGGAGAFALPEAVKEVADEAIKGEGIDAGKVAGAVGRSAALGAAVGVTSALVPQPVLKFLAEAGVLGTWGPLTTEGRLPTVQELVDAGVTLGLLKGAFALAKVPWPAKAIEPTEIIPPKGPRQAVTERVPPGPEVIEVQPEAPPEPPRGPRIAPEPAPLAAPLPTEAKSTGEAARPPGEPVTTVPETPATLVRQLEALGRGDKPAILLPPGVRPTLPERFGQVETKKGLVVFNPDAVEPLARGFPGETLEDRIRAAVESDQEGGILGYGIASKPTPGEPTTVVETRGPGGEEVQTVLTPAPPPQEAIESAKQMIPPEGGEVRVTGPEGAQARAESIIGERLQGASPSSPVFRTKLYQGRGAPPETRYSPYLIEAGVTGPILGPAKYYAFKPEDAKRYGQVTEHEVELQRPFILDSNKSWFDLLVAADAEVLDSTSREYYTEPEKIPAATRRVQEYLLNRGYDGVIVRLGEGDTNSAGRSNKRLRESFGHDQVVVFQSAAGPGEVASPPRPSLTPLTGGKTGTAKTERGTSVDTQYAVVEADSLLASHDTALRPAPSYPKDLQPRDRTRAASEEQVARLASRLDPALLGESPSAAQGAPIVGPDGVVESGNARVIALKRVYEQDRYAEPRAAYREWLAANAEHFGLDPQTIAAAKNPVLVRIRQSEVDRQKFVQEANEPSVAAMSATEQALADANRMSEGLLSRFVPAETGAFVTPQNRDFIRGFMEEVVGPSERGRYVTAEGGISQEGVTRIRNAIFAKAYGDPSAIERLAESTDNNVRNITGALLNVAPRFADLKARIERGAAYELDLTGDLAAAMRKLSELRDRGETVENYLAQTAMFDEDLSPIGKDLLDLFSRHARSAKRITEYLAAYANTVDALGHPQQEQMFDTMMPTVAETLHAAVEKVERAYAEDQATLFPDAARSGGVVAEAVRPPEAAASTPAPARSLPGRRVAPPASPEAPEPLARPESPDSEIQALRDRIKAKLRGRGEVREGPALFESGPADPKAEQLAFDFLQELRNTTPQETRPDASPATEALTDEALRDLVRVGGVQAAAGVRAQQALKAPGELRPAAQEGWTLALGITPELVRTGRVDFRGQDASDPHRLAQLAQVLRDPRFETLYIFAVKADRIVAHQGISSRFPSSTVAFLTDRLANLQDALYPGRTWETLRPEERERLYDLSSFRTLESLGRWLDRVEADGYYLLHNHPSGISRPSPDDVATTRAIRDALRGLKGHVVIDDAEYSVVAPGGKSQTFPIDPGEQKRLLAPSIPHEVLGWSVRNPDDVMRAAKAFQLPDGWVPLFFADVKLRVRAVQKIPERLFSHTEQVMGYLRARQSEFGAPSVFSHSDKPEMIEAAKRLYSANALQGHVTSRGGGFGRAHVSEPRGPARGFRVSEAGDDLTEDLLTYGRHLLKANRMPFDAWADRMAADLEEGVRPFLSDVYRQLVPTGEKPFTFTRTAVPTAITPTTTGARVSTEEVVQHFSKVFKVPIRIGHFRRPKAVGIYKVLEQVVRLKGYGDLAAAAHEVAHHVDATTNILNRLTRGERKELKALDYKPKRGDVSEGFAEFVRHYLTTDEAANKAPTFHATFTTWLPGSGLADAFKSSRAVVDQWRGQGSLERVKAQIATTEGWFAQTRRLFSRPRTLWHWFVDHFYNRLSPLKRTAEEMAGTKQVLDAMPIEAAFWPFAKVAAMTAAAKARNMALYGMADKAGNKVGPGLIETFGPIARELQDPETLHDWYAYAYSRHALDVIARGKEPGIKEEDARAVVDLFANRPGWKQAADGLTRWHRQLIDYLVDAGGLSQEVADLFQRLYPNYISLARHIENIQTGTGGPGGRYANLPGAVKRLKGSGRLILPPLETALIYAERIIGLADKYRVGKMLVTAAEQYGKLGEIAEQVPPDLTPHTFSLERIKDQLESLGADLSGADLDGMLTLFENNIRPDPLDNILVLWRNGERQAWRLREDLYRALLALDKPYRLPDVLHYTLGAAARAIRLGATGLRAGFSLITNPMRDVQTAIMQTEAQRTDPASVALGSVRGMLRDLTNDEVAQIFKRGGGQMAQPLGIDRRFLAEAIQEILAQDPKSKALNWMQHPVDSLREVFSIPELGPRLAEFEAELKRLGWKSGQPVTFEQYVKGQFKAQNVTVDFREGGSLSMWLNQITPFHNANMQGPARMADIIRRRPWDVLRRGLLWLTLPTLALWWAYKDEEWYTNLPPMERYRYWHVKLPNEAVIRIPKPFEWGHLFSSIPEAIMDWAYRQDPTAMKEALGRTLDDITPPFIPGAVQPAIEVLANRDLYFDRPLVGKRLERLPPERQVQPWTTETARAIGKLFGVSPIYVEHLIKRHTGGLAPDLFATAEYTARQIGALPARGTRPPQLADIPVAGRLFLRPEVTRVFDDFYTSLENLEQAQAGRRETLGSRRGQRMPAPGDLTQMRRAAQHLSEARDRARRIVESDLSDDEKRQTLTEIHEQMLTVAKQAMGEQTYSGRTLRRRPRQE